MPGDLVVAEAAVRDEGTTGQYVPAGFPAVADREVTAALVAGLQDARLPHHVGIVHSKDSFYGQREPARMPVAPELEARWRVWIRAGVLCSEMEAAAIFVVARIRQMRAGALLLVGGNQELEGAQSVTDETLLLDGAVAGLRALIERDRGTPGAAGQVKAHL